MIDWFFWGASASGVVLVLIVAMLLLWRKPKIRSTFVEATAVISAAGIVDAFNRFQSSNVLPYIQQQVKSKREADLKNLHQDAAHMSFLEAHSFLGEELSPILLLFKETASLPIEDVFGLAGQFYELIMVCCNPDKSYSMVGFTKEEDHFIDYVASVTFSQVISKLEEKNMGHCQQWVTAFFEGQGLSEGRKYLDLRFYHAVSQKSEQRMVEDEVVVCR